MADVDPPARRDGRARAGLDTPVRRAQRRVRIRPTVDPESFGRLAERFARFLGTARFLVYMTAFVAVWLAWNTLAPVDSQFDSSALNYTLLTLILSLQASYAAPLILLAQNRQADRDRVQNSQDRTAAERALADTEFLTREVAALKIALRDVATRDFLRSELRTLLDDLDHRSGTRSGLGGDTGDERGEAGRQKSGGRKKKTRTHHADPAPPAQARHEVPVPDGDPELQPDGLQPGD